MILYNCESNEEEVSLTSYKKPIFMPGVKNIKKNDLQIGISVELNYVENIV